MGARQVVIRGACAAVALCVARIASAGTVTLDNGITGTGHLDVSVDDFGSFGRDIGPNASDNFQPPNYARPDPMTFASESFVFMLAGSMKGAVALSSSAVLYKLVEGNQGTGLAGNFPALGRVVNMPITLTGGVAHSQFTIGDSSQSAIFRVDLDQRLVTETAPATRLEQSYTFTNMGTATVSFIFHSMWDMNLYYLSVDANDDYVGVGQGLCYVFMHDPNSTTQGGAMADGGSTIGVGAQPLPISAYYGGKLGVMPEDTKVPAFTSSDHTLVWTNFGMPITWRNELAKVGLNTAGETNFAADGIVGLEYQLALAGGQTATIKLNRHWGKVSLPCVSVGVNCGNGVADPGETCDSQGADTATCNGATCTAPMCGDGIVNAAAGEQCESNSMDSADCNGKSCTLPSCGDGYVNTAAGELCDDGGESAACNANCTPAMCGDGIVNATAGEECESDPLCDPSSCKAAFSLGGGCAGCGVGGSSSGGSFALTTLVAAIMGRRRRRARRA